VADMKPARLLNALALTALLTGALTVAAERADDAAVETEETEQTAATATEAGPDAEVEGETGAADTAAADEPPAATNGSSPDVFVPTEEISEDYAVSFPVDI
jgi:hypothetical protein